jgi:hypothetical protein
VPRGLSRGNVMHMHVSGCPPVPRDLPESALRFLITRVGLVFWLPAHQEPRALVPLH